MAEENNKYTPPELVNSAASFGSAFAITESAIDAHNIQALPDRPNATTSYGGSSYSAKDLKERFEGLARLAINAINTLIYELGSDTVSSNIKIPEWGGTKDLGALVEAVKSGKLAQSIKVGNGDGGEGKEETFSTLQDVLYYLITYVSNLKSDITDGDFAKALKVDPYNEASTLQEVLAYLTTRESELASDIATASSRIDTNAKDIESIKAVKLYTPKGTETAIPTNVTLSVGDVYSIEPADGGSFTYNGKVFPFGTNMVYLGEDESGNDKWDSLGGTVDYRDITQWDLIITNPDDLSDILSEASGNVLVKIPYYEGFTSGGIYAELRADLKILDFGGSRLDGGGTLKAVEDSGTVIRNLVSRDWSFELHNFGLVDNVSAVTEVHGCGEVKSSRIVRADKCNSIHNCTIVPNANGDTLITNCRNISDIDIYSFEESWFDGSVEFTNCHHISNVHCAENENHADEGNSLAYLIHYIDCKFVDPFTCAGYLNDDGDDGRIYYPKWDGSVWCTDFKVEDVATKTDIGNIEEALRIINEGGTT